MHTGATERSAERAQPEPAPLELLVLRADDLLDFQLTFVNLRVQERADTSVLVRADAAADAFVVITFAPQHIVEEAFFDPGPMPGPPPVPAALSGPTRLVFRVPPSLAELPLTRDTLLDWSGLQPSLAANALGSVPGGAGLAAQPAPAPPPPTATAIEAPYRIVLSPGPHGRWHHAGHAVTHGGWTELWHTRLSGGGMLGPESLEQRRAVRAIWTPDLVDEVPGLPTASMTAGNRREFVRLSSDFSGGARPAAIANDGLMLSARGAWLDLTGRWNLPDPPLPQFGVADLHETLVRVFREAQLGDNPDEMVREAIRQIVAESPEPHEQQPRLLREMLNQLSLFRDDIGAIAQAWLSELPALPVDTVEWRHRAAQGRDTCVRIATPGYLIPFGHRVTLVTVTDRRFSAAPDGSPTAYLRLSSHLVVNEPYKDFGAVAGAYASAGRENPLVSARLLDTITPALDEPTPGDALFWPRVGDRDLLWTVVCADVEGRRVELSMPLLFMPAVDENGFRFDEARARDVYRGDPRRQIPIAVQEVAFARGREGRPGEGTLLARSLVFDARAGSELGAGQLPAGAPRILPAIVGATVSIPAVDALLGAAAVQRGTPVLFDRTYLDSGFDDTVNRGELFLRTTQAIALPFHAERGGGLARPNFSVGGVSRALGAVADPGSVVDGVFVADNFVPDARILGGLSLKRLLPKQLTGFTPQQVPELAGLDPDALWNKLVDQATAIRIPTIVQRKLRDAAGMPSAVETQFAWKPALLDGAIPGTDLTLDPAAHLILVTTLRAPLDGGEPTFASRGELSSFGLEFAGVARVGLQRLAFSARSATKLDVSAEGVALTFLGDLEFINEIQKYIPAGGFSDPPAITVSADGISANYTLGLPSVGVGVFSLQNIGLSAGLTLPFVDAPIRLCFALSERHRPFLVSVALFGGGGFFALEVAAGQLPEVEGAIEFGGNFSLDLIVASGGVHLLAGIYFRKAGASAQLWGYLRAGGALTVLGLVTLAVEFYLVLAYGTTETGQKKVWGEAAVTVGIELLAFSQHVTLHIRRELPAAPAIRRSTSCSNPSIGTPTVRPSPPEP